MVKYNSFKTANYILPYTVKDKYSVDVDTQEDWDNLELKYFFQKKASITSILFITFSRNKNEDLYTSTSILTMVRILSPKSFNLIYLFTSIIPNFKRVAFRIETI